MSADHIDRAAEVIEHVLSRHGEHGTYLDVARTLADSGLLVTPEHDAAVAARAWDEGCAAGLREANDKARGAQNNPAINPYGREAGESNADT